MILTKPTFKQVEETADNLLNQLSPLCKYSDGLKELRKVFDRDLPYNNIEKASITLYFAYQHIIYELEYSELKNYSFISYINHALLMAFLYKIGYEPSLPKENEYSLFRIYLTPHILYRHIFFQLAGFVYNDRDASQHDETIQKIVKILQVSILCDIFVANNNERTNTIHSIWENIQEENGTNEPMDKKFFQEKYEWYKEQICQTAYGKVMFDEFKYDIFSAYIEKLK